MPLHRTVMFGGYLQERSGDKQREIVEVYVTSVLYSVIMSQKSLLFSNFSAIGEKNQSPAGIARSSTMNALETEG